MGEQQVQPAQLSAVEELQKLEASAAEAAVRIAQLRTQARVEVKTLIERTAKEAGYTVQELFGAKKARATSALWVNPNDASQSWCGVGKRPSWIHDLLAQGFTKEQLIK